MTARLSSDSSANSKPEHAIEQSGSRAVAEIEGGCDQQQARGDEANHGELHGAGALAEQQAFEQDGERGEAGETQGGDADTGDLHRNEKVSQCAPSNSPPSARPAR